MSGDFNDDWNADWSGGGGNSYRAGDYWTICDLSGFKVRMSETVKQWNGLRVLRRFADMRNPQDFVRVRPERNLMRDVRPEPADVFVTVPTWNDTTKQWA